MHAGRRAGRAAGRAGRAGVRRTGGDQHGCVAQMSFGGHHAKDGSDKLQKKLQAMATDQELEDGLAGIDIRDEDDDGMSSDDVQKNAAEIAKYAASIGWVVAAAVGWVWNK